MSKPGYYCIAAVFPWGLGYSYWYISCPAK